MMAAVTVATIVSSLMAVALGLGASTAGTTAGEPPSSLSEALVALGQATALANDDPAAGADPLAALLAQLPEFSDQLAADESALRARTLAWLTLARARLNLGDRDAASAAIDVALRNELGGDLETAALGPTLSALADERASALAERHPLAVTCSVPCTVRVQERAAEPGAPLPPGEYRVVISASDEAAGLAPISTTLRLPDGAAIRFGPEPSGQSEGPDPAGTTSRPATDAERGAPAATPGRLIPRWAEVIGMGLGAAAVGTGAALTLLHGRCTDGGSVMGPNPCDDLYDTRLAGAATLAAGGVILLGSTTLLVVDEVRTAKNDRSARVSVRIRF
jgi:hypothetical protein